MVSKNCILPRMWIVAALFVLLLIDCGQAQVKIEKHIEITKSNNDRNTISIQAVNASPPEIFKELEKKINIKILSQGKEIPNVSLNLTIPHMQVKEAIKRLLKASGINNHVISYKHGREGRNDTIELHILSFSKEQLPASIKTPLKNSSLSIEKPEVVRTPQISDVDFFEKVEKFKEKYEWDSYDTKELAGFLLDNMPEQIKKSGVDNLIRMLDEKLQSKGTTEVTEEMLIDNIVAMSSAAGVPEELKKREIKKYIMDYKGLGTELPQKTSSEHFQEILRPDHKQKIH